MFNEVATTEVPNMYEYYMKNDNNAPYIKEIRNIFRRFCKNHMKPTCEAVLVSEIRNYHVDMIIELNSK